MVRLVRLTVLFWCVAYSQTCAQVRPTAIKDTIRQANLHPTREMQQVARRQVESEARALFRNLPPIYVIAIDGGNPSKPLAQKTDIELELRQSGIEIATDQEGKHVTLMAAVLPNKDGTWTAQFEMQENVILNRPGAPTIPLVTYEDGFGLATNRESAEKVLVDSAKNLCLLYMTYSK